MKKWPRKMWCVCYRDVNFHGGWAPYAGHVYWYREDAVDRARELGGTVKPFNIRPYSAKRR